RRIPIRPARGIASTRRVHMPGERRRRRRGSVCVSAAAGVRPTISFWDRSMARLLLEVIVQTLADAREAASGGADRLEVVRAIRDGGLTPLVSLVRSIAAEMPLPLRVMVRENAGYATHDAELPVLRRAAAEFAAVGADGL